MITPENFVKVLENLGFYKMGESRYIKHYDHFDESMEVNTKTKKLFYPKSIKNHERNAYYDDSHKENLVVFECVDRLLSKGYRPEHLELEKEWPLGHDTKSGRADICVEDADGNMLSIIECKTAGKEFENAKKILISDGGQLFSY